jgi:hypothetical protein
VFNPASVASGPGAAFSFWKKLSLDIIAPLEKYYDGFAGTEGMHA